MKPRRIFSAARLSFPFASALVALFAAQSLHAAPLTWAGSINSSWNTTDANWTGLSWNNVTPDDAIFGAAGVGTVTLTEAITAGSLTFNTAGYTINTSTFGLTLNTGITATESATIQSGVGGSIILGAANSWSVASTKTLTVSSAISGGFGLTKTGLGTMTLSGANTGFTGITTVNGGTLSITNNNALGTTAGATTVNGSNGSTGTTLSLSSAAAGLTIAENINLFGNATGRATLLNGSAFNHTLSGAIDVSSATNLAQFSSDSTGSITVTGDITGTLSGGAVLFVRGASTSASNRLLGSVNLTGGNFAKTDGGTWLVGASGKSYSWSNTLLANGTLRMGAAGVLSSSTGGLLMGEIGVRTPTLDLNGFSQTVSGITYNTGTGTRTITSATAATLTVNAATDSTATGSGANSIVLTGALSLIKQGAGTLSLNGANTFTGGLNIRAGTVTSALANSMGTGTVTIGDSANTGLAATWSSSTGNVTYANAISVAGNGTNTILVNGFNPIYSGAISLATSNLTVTSNNAGGSTISSTGGITGTGNLTIKSDSTNTASSAITFSGATLNFTGSITNSGAATSTTASNTTISSVIGTNVTGVIQNSANSQLTLSGANTFTSAVTVTQGQLNASSLAGFGAITAVTNLNLGSAGALGTLNYTGAATSSTRPIVVGGAGGGRINSTTGLLTLTGTVNLNSGPLTIGGANNVTIGSASATNRVSGTGAHALTKTGTGTLTLSTLGANAAIVGAMPINVQAGTLQVNTTAVATTNLLGTGAISITPGATTGVIGGTLGVSVGAVTNTLANTIAIPNAAGIAQISTSGGITFNSTATVTFAAGANTPTLRLSNTNGTTFALNLQGAISGTGNLQLNASGTTSGPPITVSGAQNQTGTISNIGNTAGTTAVSTLSGTIGAGITGISQAGVNPFTVSASVPLSAGLNTFTSTGAGAFNFTNASTFSGSQNLTFNANSTGGINISGTSLNHTGTVTNSGTSSGATTISSAIGANVGNIIQNSATSPLILSGTNLYTGTATITSGLMQFSTTSAMEGFTGTPNANVQISVASGGILGLAYPTFTAANVTDLVNNANGGTYSNVTFAATGASIGLDTTAGSTSFTDVLANPTGSALGLVKLGTNTLTLGDANTFSGPVSIRNGTLSAGILNSVTTPAPVGASSLGVPSSAANGTISLGFLTTAGTLNYTGAGETTDRVIDLAGTTGGGGITNAGSGTLTFSSPMTFTGTGVKNLTLAGASNTTFGSAIGTSNNLSTGTSVLQIAKSDAGTVTLSGANFARDLIISGGTLDTGAGSLTLGNTGAITIAATANATINGNIILAGVGSAGNGADIGSTVGGVTLTINANISGGDTNNIDFWSSTTGVTILNGANTWSGQSRVAGQIVQVASLNSVVGGTASSNFGAPTTVANGTIGLSGGATLRYAGTGETTDRVINLDATTSGGIIEQSGTGLLKFTSNFTATANGAKVLTLQGSTSGTGEISGAIVNSTGTTGITKAGTGTWTLSGANTYTGATTVNGGNLILGSTGSLSNSGIVINSGGTLSPVAGFTVGNTLTAAAGGRLTLNAGGVLNLADGTIGNLNLVQNSTFAGNAATFAGGSIIFDISDTAADMIDVRLNNVTGTGLATSSGMNGISFNPIAGSLGVGSYTLINAAGSLNNSNFFLASPNLVVGGTLYNLSLSLSGTNEVLTVATGGAAATPSTAFWNGTTDTSWALGSAGGVATNWVTAATGAVETWAVPGSTTNLTLTANTVGTGGLSTTLDQAFTINSLAFSGTGSDNIAGSTIASGIGGVASTLTINAAALTGNTLGNGITVAAGSGANTISAPVILGGNQTWTNNSTNALSVTGGISGTGFGLTVAGAGTVVLGSSNTFDGALSIGSGATGGTASISAGAGLGTNATLNLGGTTGAGTLIYTGTAATITQAVNLSGTTGGGVIDQSGTGHLNFTSDLTATGVGAKTLTLQGSTAGTGELSGAIVNGSGTTAVTKTGTGTWTLSGANTYTGTTTVSNGTLKMGSATALSSTNPVTLAGTGTFDLNGNNITIGTLTSSVNTAAITNTGAGSGTNTLAFTSGATAQALITDGPTRATALRVTNGNGNFALNNPGNTFTGGITLAHATGGTRLNPGTVVAGAYGTGAITVGEAPTDQAGIFFGTGGQTFANPIIVNTALGTDRVGIRADGATTLSGVITANLAPVTFTSNSPTAGAFTLTNQVTGSSGLVLDIVSLSAAATSFNVTLNNATLNANDYQGDTVINLNAATGKSATLNLGAANQIPNGTGTGNVIINTNGTGVGRLNLGGFSETINGLSGNGTVNGATTGTPTNTLTVGDNNANGLTFSGVIQNTAGTLSLTKIGSGTQTLSGANTFSGNTLVSAGTIALGNALALQNSAYDTASANGGLDATGFTTPTLGGLTGSGNLSPTLITAYGSITNLTLKPLTGVTNTHSGIIPDGASGMALTKSGAGTQVLSGANTYTGTTTINQGTLKVTGSGVLGGATGSTTDANNIVFGQNLNSGALEFDTVANLGAADEIRFRNTGGTAGQGGALVYVGTTDETLGKTIQCDTSIGIRIESNSVGGSLTVNGPFSQTNRSIYLGGTGIGNNTIASAFTGTGALIKRGAGTWTLSGANTYSG